MNNRYSVFDVVMMIGFVLIIVAMAVTIFIKNTEPFEILVSLGMWGIVSFFILVLLHGTIRGVPRNKIKSLMRRYRQSSHSKHDLKVHLIWVPKYRKRVLRGPVAVRTRDLIRQIAMEHDLHIISGKVAKDHVHVFISYRPMQTVSDMVK